MATKPIDAKNIAEADHKEFSLLYEKFNFKSTCDDIPEKQLSQYKEKLGKLLMKNPEVVKLMESVIRKKCIITIEFPDFDALDTFGAWDNNTNTLYLAIDLAQNNHLFSMFLYYFVFELNNANNDTLTNIEITGFKSANEYATALEHAEFITKLNTDEQVLTGIQKYGWPKDTLSPDETDALMEEEKTGIAVNTKLEKHMTSVKKPRSPSGYSHFDAYCKTYHQFKLKTLTKEIELLTKGIENNKTSPIAMYVPLFQKVLDRKKSEFFTWEHAEQRLEAQAKMNLEHL